MKINIPTKITISRIVMIIVMLIALFVISLVGELTGWVSPTLGNSGINLVYFICLIVFVIASLTDMIDGKLARKWNQVTTLGKFLDPIADKLLVDSMLIVLAIRWNYAPMQSTLVPAFCAIIMILRDLVVDAFRAIAASKNVVIAANIFGKLKTVFQMVVIPLVLLNGWPFSYFDSSWGYFTITNILVFITTMVSLASGVIYIFQNKAVLKEGE